MALLNFFWTESRFTNVSSSHFSFHPVTGLIIFKIAKFTSANLRCTDVIKGRPQVICLIGLYVDLVSDELFEVSSVSISVELSYHRTQELKV